MDSMQNPKDAENQPAFNPEISNEISRRIIGNQVVVRQGGAQSMEADHLIVRQGGAASVRATRLDVTQGFVGYIQTDAASMTAAKAGVVVANGDTHIDQSLSQVYLSKGNSTIDQSAIAVLVANEVKVESSSTIFLLAKKVEGNLTTMFGPRESLLFGAIAGLVVGAILLMSKFVKNKK